MKRCTSCRKDQVAPAAVSASVEVGEHLFTALVPGFRCTHCGETYIDGPALGHFEECVATELARAGASSGEALRFMRKTLGLRGSDLADLLDVTAETISRWETGKWPLDRRAMALVAALASERVEGRATTRRQLEVLRSPKKIPRRVDLGNLAVATTPRS